MGEAKKGLLALVASGDRTSCQVVSSVLERNGYAVRQVHDGREVIGEVTEHPCQLVFLDLLLPNVSGIQVFQVIRSISGLKIVILARNEQSFAAMIKLAREKGALGPLLQPVIPDRVEQLLRELGPAEGGR